MEADEPTDIEQRALEDATKAEEAARAVHAALKGFLDEGETPICWALTIDVARADGVRYLAHRAGGGEDGSDEPPPWSVHSMASMFALSMERLMEPLSGPEV